MSAPERLEPIRKRLLAALEAANYCGYECREAVYRVKGFPPPVPPPGPGERPKWDIRDLDAWIDARKAAGVAPAHEGAVITAAEADAHARSIVARARRARRRKGA